jgi:HAD superfamily hydrolase (TIGR01509 family)
MPTLIFDLSEVLIAGLLGIENPIAARLQLDPKNILRAFAGQPLQDICCGRLSENEYLTEIIQRQQWDLPLDLLKHIIRDNFHQCVPGMVDLITQMAEQSELILLSDHAIEWIEYIHTIHPFLGLFKKQFFSFELKQTKQEPSTFQKVLRMLGREPEECLFVDDSAKNVSVAASIGLPGIQFTTVDALKREFAMRGVGCYGD